MIYTFFISTVALPQKNLNFLERTFALCLPQNFVSIYSRRDSMFVVFEYDN